MKIQKSAALFSLLPAGALAATLLQPFPVLAAGSPYAGGSGTAEDPWQIETAEEFSAIREHLDGNFVLTADIDLSGMGNFDPIGTFTPGGEDPEQADESTAFTGTLDGQGHTVTGLTCIQGEDRTGTGLFGAVSGDAMLTDFTLGDVTVVGGFGTGALAGYISGDAVVDNVDLTGENNRVLASTMVGGLVGAANNEVIRNCDGEANVGITGTNEIFAQCAGVLLGGVEGADVENCHVSGGTVTAFGELVNDTGINGLGGLAGCVMSTDHLTDSSAANVSIRANEDAMLIGGLTGFSGNAEGGMTRIANCSTSDIIIDAPASAERIGGITGGGFYVTQYAQYYAAPLPMEIVNCTATDITLFGGRVAGSIAGYLSDDSVVSASQGSMTKDREPVAAKVGGTPETLSLDQVGGGTGSPDAAS